MVEIAEIPAALKRRPLAGVLVAVLVALAIGTVVSFVSGSPQGQVAEPLPSQSTVVTSAGEIFVHVTGAVIAPGVVSIDIGSRVVDALAASGGLAPDADSAAINLAREVGDGEAIYVPRIGENVAPGASGPRGAASSTGLINLNVADATALESLPHIGPALAARIVEWRQANGSFRSVDELTEVPGIGEKTFEDIKPLVTV